MCFGTFLGMADRGGTKYVPPRREEIRPLMGGTAASPAPAAERAAAVGQRAIGQHSAGVPVPRPNASPLPPGGGGQNISVTAQAQLGQQSYKQASATYPPPAGRRSPQADAAPTTSKTSASQPSSPPKVGGVKQIPRGMVSPAPTLSELTAPNRQVIAQEWASKIQLPSLTPAQTPIIASAEEIVIKYGSFAFPTSVMTQYEERRHVYESCLLPVLSPYADEWNKFTDIQPNLIYFRAAEATLHWHPIGKLASIRCLLYMLLSSENNSDILRVLRPNGSQEESLLLQSYPSWELLDHLRDLLQSDSPVNSSIRTAGTAWTHLVVETLPNPAEQHPFAFQKDVPIITIEQLDRPTFRTLALQLIDELELDPLVNNGPSPFELEAALKVKKETSLPFICITGRPTNESIPEEARPQSLVKAFESKGAERFYKFVISGVRDLKDDPRADYGMFRPGMSLAQFERLFTFATTRTNILPHEVATTTCYGDTVFIGCQGGNDSIVGMVVLPGPQFGRYMMHPMDRIFWSRLQ